jgi:hypothetical protein
MIPLRCCHTIILLDMVSDRLSGQCSAIGLIGKQRDRPFFGNKIRTNPDCAILDRTIQSVQLMSDEQLDDPFFSQLCEGYTEVEISEIQQYVAEWTAGIYASVAHNILDHAARKPVNPLRYLRKAHNFNQKRAKRVPKTGYRADGSAIYRQGNEYLIVRLDRFGSEKIVTYGVNDD